MVIYSDTKTSNVFKIVISVFKEPPDGELKLSKDLTRVNRLKLCISETLRMFNLLPFSLLLPPSAEFRTKTLMFGTLGPSMTRQRPEPKVYTSSEPNGRESEKFESIRY